MCKRVNARQPAWPAGDRLLDRALGRQDVVDTAPEVQRTLIVRWMPPDPDDRSNVIEQEPD
jgi:hypothetical protein